jgi:hypothetical protein
MADKEIEQVVAEDDDLLEASKTEDQDEQLTEFKADNTGGDVIKGAEVPEPTGTGSSSRGADKSGGDSSAPADAQKASVSKAALMSQVMGKMNKMSKETLQKLAGEVGGAQYGKNKLPASKPQSTGKDAMPKVDAQGKPPEQAPPKVSAGAAKEAVGEIFAGEELSEEFTEKATTIFEATVNAKLIEQHAHMQEQFSQRLEEEKESFRSELTDRVDEYLDYVTEEWMKENEVAIENALKVEVAETFIQGIKNLFQENYISIPEEKVDLVDELTQQKEELEGKLEESVQSNIDQRKANDELERFKIFSDACSGLTMTQKDKLSQLSEGIEYESNDDYRSKIDLLKEHYFTSNYTTETEDLNSDPVDVDTDEPMAQDPGMAAYAQAISRSVRK